MTHAVRSVASQIFHKGGSPEDDSLDRAHPRVRVTEPAHRLDSAFEPVPRGQSHSPPDGVQRIGQPSNHLRGIYADAYNAARNVRPAAWKTHLVGALDNYLVALTPTELIADSNHRPKNVASRVRAFSKFVDTAASAPNPTTANKGKAQARQRAIPEPSTLERPTRLPASLAARMCAEAVAATLPLGRQRMHRYVGMTGEMSQLLWRLRDVDNLWARLFEARDAGVSALHVRVTLDTFAQRLESRRIATHRKHLPRIK